MLKICLPFSAVWVHACYGMSECRASYCCMSYDVTCSGVPYLTSVNKYLHDVWSYLFFSFSFFFFSLKEWVCNGIWLHHCSLDNKFFHIAIYQPTLPSFLTHTFPTHVPYDYVSRAVVGSKLPPATSMSSKATSITVAGVRTERSGSFAGSDKKCKRILPANMCRICLLSLPACSVSIIINFVLNYPSKRNVHP